MDIRLKTLEEKIELLYEAYKDGSITLEERERLIQEAKDGEYIKDIMKNFDVDIKATPNERFETVKSYLYTECAAGHITEDERERLISYYREDCYPSA